MILEELKKLKSHPTADELHRIVRLRLPRLSIATVYRNLEVLREEGLAKKIDLPNVRRRWDGNTESHYHVRCVNCGKVDDVTLEPLAHVEESVRELCSYKILAHCLEFVGLCPDCLKGDPEAVDGNG